MDAFILFSGQGERYFKLDPDFPRRLHTSGVEITATFLQSFLADYSKRGLTDPTDRAVAISGLVDRISSALPSRSSYGVFDFFLHRTLLWKVAGQQKIEKIKYSSPNKQPPSWSWMAYRGGIQFLGNEYGELSLFKDLVLNGNALDVVVWKFRDCHVEVSRTSPERRILGTSAGERKERGWVIYDVEDGNDLSLERAVIMAKRGGRGERCYMLVVKLQAGRSEYERVGMREIEEEWVWQRQTGAVLI